MAVEKDAHVAHGDKENAHRKLDEVKAAQRAMHTSNALRWANAAQEQQRAAKEAAEQLQECHASNHAIANRREVDVHELRQLQAQWANSELGRDGQRDKAFNTNNDLVV